MDARAAVEPALEAARRKGLAAEAYFAAGRELEVRCFRGQVEHFERSAGRGLGLRVVSSGRAGCAYTEDLSAAAVEEALAAAAEAAALLEPQQGVELSDWPAAPEPEGLDCPELAALPVERKIQLALELEAAARAAGPEIVNVPWAGYSEQQVERCVANTAGLLRCSRAGCAVLYAQALAGRGQERKSHFEYAFARRAAELEPARLGRLAGERAAELLGAKQPASGRREVLFAPRPTAALLAVFSGVFSGRNAEEGRSPLAGRLGQRLGPEALSVVDDATLAGAPAARPFDAEGVPCRRLAVVEAGRFAAFLHTADTARRAGVEPTGHAVRSYQSPPGIGPSNLFVAAGSAPVEELRAGAQIEVVELMGFAGTNPVSGEFSAPALGFLIENGRRARPLHDFTVAGNLLELLGAVRAAGADFEFAAPGLSAAFGGPSLLVGGLSVGGKS